MYDVTSHSRFSPYGDPPPPAPMLIDFLNHKVDNLQRRVDEMEARLNNVQSTLEGWESWYYNWGWLLWKIRHWWLGTSSTDSYEDDKDMTMSTDVSVPNGDP